MCWVRGLSDAMAQAALRARGWMDGWKSYPKMMVSGLPAVNISSRLKLQPWQAAKGECDLHRKCLLGAHLCQHLQLLQSQPRCLLFPLWLAKIYRYLSRLNILIHSFPRNINYELPALWEIHYVLLKGTKSCFPFQWAHKCLVPLSDWRRWLIPLVLEAAVKQVWRCRTTLQPHWGWIIWHNGACN